MENVKEEQQEPSRQFEEFYMGYPEPTELSKTLKLGEPRVIRRTRYTEEETKPQTDKEGNVIAPAKVRTEKGKTFEAFTPPEHIQKILKKDIKLAPKKAEIEAKRKFLEKRRKSTTLIDIRLAAADWLEQNKQHKEIKDGKKIYKKEDWSEAIKAVSPYIVAKNLKDRYKLNDDEAETILKFRKQVKEERNARLAPKKEKRKEILGELKKGKRLTQEQKEARRLYKVYKDALRNVKWDFHERLPGLIPAPKKSIFTEEEKEEDVELPKNPERLSEKSFKEKEEKLKSKYKIKSKE